MIRRIYILVVLFFAFGVVKPASALTDPASTIQEKKIGFFTELGAKVDPNLTFTDASGRSVTIGSLLKSNVPTIITPMYYGCPRLCGLLLNGFIDLVKKMKLSMGSEYNVITVSFDPSEAAELAKGKEQSVFEEVSRSDVNQENWHFLVGGEQNIKALMDQLGFHYQKDGEEYAHSSGIIVLTPQGEISQYFTGIEFSPWDVRLSLIEASKGSIGSAIDHILLFCYRFDPTQGKYTWVAFNVLRGGVLAAVLLFAYVAYFFSKRVKRA